MSPPIALAALLLLAACGPKAPPASGPAAPGPAAQDPASQPAPQPASRPASQPATRPEPYANPSGQPAAVAQITILLRDPQTGDLGAATVTSCPGAVPLILDG